MEHGPVVLLLATLMLGETFIDFNFKITTKRQQQNANRHYNAFVERIGMQRNENWSGPAYRLRPSNQNSNLLLSIQ